MNSTFVKIKENFLKMNFKSFFKEAFSVPIYLLTHPIRGFDEFKREKLSKRYVAIFYLLMMILTQIISYNENGFLVNKNIHKDFNLFLTIAIVIFPVVIVTIGNWASTALMNGKGTMSDIFRVICYSFFPYVWLSLFASLISNYITIDEIVFFDFLNTLGVILLGYMIFFGLMGIHEYGLLQTFLMFAFTIVAISAIIFIMLLFLSLIQLVFTFLGSVYSEFVMRFV